MRKGLPLLIRLAQQNADEVRGDLARIARASAEAAKVLDDHDAVAASEASSAMRNPDALAAMATWVPHAARSRTPLRHRAAELDRSEGAARELLRDAIARTKRLELALDAIQAVHRQDAARRADQQADEHELARRASVGPTDA